jgi:DNA-binding CsgD family transcriptional regulator
VRPLDALRPRERDYLALLARGFNDRDIAEREHVGRRTVISSLHNAEKRTGLTRAQLVAAWWENSMNDMLEIAYLNGLHDGLRVRGVEAVQQYRALKRGGDRRFIRDAGAAPVVREAA